MFTVYCLAYVMGLLLTGLPWKVLGLPVGAVIMLLLGAIASTYPLIPHSQKVGVKPRTWLLAGLCGFFSSSTFSHAIAAAWAK